MGWFRNLISGGSSWDDQQAQLLEWLGVDKSDPKAINEATYFTCLKVLSETMGKLPLKLYEYKDGGGRERADPTIGERLLMERPNPYMTPATFWGTIETACEHYGNAYAWMQTVYDRQGKFGGDYYVRAYWPMRSDYVQILMDDAGIFGDAGKIYYKYSEPEGGREYVFPSEQVMHFKTWLTWDGITGKSVRDILKEMVEGAGSAQKYQKTLYKSGLAAAAVLQYTGDVDKTRRKKLQAEYNELLTGARNAGKVVAIPVGMTLQPLTYKLTDAQFYELKKYSALQIAAAFGVKPNQINDYEKSSYANSEAQQLAFLVDTMLYRITQYEQEINYKCLTREERENGKFFKFNEKALLRTDTAAQVNAITAAVQNGVYTPNEGRAFLDLPNREGGDQLIVNGNYIPLTRVGEAYGKEENTDGSQDQR